MEKSEFEIMRDDEQDLRHSLSAAGCFDAVRESQSKKILASAENFVQHCSSCGIVPTMRRFAEYVANLSRTWTGTLVTGSGTSDAGRSTSNP